MEANSAASAQNQSVEHKVDLCASLEDPIHGNPFFHQSPEKEEKSSVCRVCQCLESDRRGDAALYLLNISTPSPDSSVLGNKDEINSLKVIVEDAKSNKKYALQPNVVDFTSIDAKIRVPSNDTETDVAHQPDLLVNLGCLCKGDLSLVHYACALKWFINRGSTICEICGTIARTIRPEDFKKVTASLKDYENLRERTEMGEHNHVISEVNSGNNHAVASMRSVRLAEITSWFNPQTNSAAVSLAILDQSSIILEENITTSENLAARWAVECTGILVAAGLLTVTLAWLIAHSVGKKTATSGLPILLGGICALTVVIFLRLVVLSRIKYGPARYWAILFVFWFLVFGIWASRGHGSYTA